MPGVITDGIDLSQQQQWSTAINQGLPLGADDGSLSVAQSSDYLPPPRLTKSQLRKEATRIIRKLQSVLRTLDGSDAPEVIRSGDHSDSKRAPPSDGADTERN